MKDKILDISVNLARVSDWVLSGNPAKQKRVNQFLTETERLLSQLSPDTVSVRFRPTLARFSKEFKELLKRREGIDKEFWAERALTWANILQHRARLA